MLWERRPLTKVAGDDPLGLMLASDDSALYHVHFRTNVYITSLIPSTGNEAWSIGSNIGASPYVHVMDVAVTGTNEHTVVSGSERGTS